MLLQSDPAKVMEVPPLIINPMSTDLFTVVDCGARRFFDRERKDILEIILRGFQNYKVIGFDPDKVECENLNKKGGDKYQFFPVLVGEKGQKSTFYNTKMPAASSIYKPNTELFAKFLGCAEYIEVIKEETIEMEALDDFLPGKGIDTIDFLKLDVQGAEIKILNGAVNFLDKTILGIFTEVEFNHIYIDQPLIGDVDQVIRSKNFMLFDLSRTRYRRGSIPAHIPTGGQIMWGDALYLKNYQVLLDRDDIVSALRLAILSSCLGIPDYSVEILDQIILQKENYIDEESRQAILYVKENYLKILNTFETTKKLQNYSWKD